MITNNHQRTAIGITILFNIFIFWNSHAQVENIPLVTVTGEAVIKAPPDYCILGIRVEKEIPTDSRGETVGFRIFDNEDTRISLFKHDDEDIIETTIQVNDGKYVKEIFITIRDLKRLEQYLIQLARIGFDNYVFVEYRTSNYEALQNEARQQAVKSAKKKSKLLASQVNQSIGSAHLIEELESKSYNMFNQENYVELENITYNLGADKHIIEPGYISITARVKVSFDLIKM